MLNKIFEHIYCLNLDRRADRWQKMQGRLKGLGITAHRWSGVDGHTLPTEKLIPGLKKGEVGITYSYLDILEDAKKNNYQSVLILEDDCIFINNFNQELESRWQSGIPDTWEYINFGPNLSPGGWKRVNNHILQLNGAYATHAVGFKSSVIQIMIDELKTFYAPMDVILSQKVLPNINAYGFNPSIIWQDIDYSDIVERNVNYKFLEGQ